jgi:hypothetical protein
MVAIRKSDQRISLISPPQIRGVRGHERVFTSEQLRGSRNILGRPRKNLLGGIITTETLQRQMQHGRNVVVVNTEQRVGFRSSPWVNQRPERVGISEHVVQALKDFGQTLVALSELAPVLDRAPSGHA